VSIIEIVIGVVLFLLLCIFTLIMNPPSAWVDRAGKRKKDKPL
jgi:hypothetical protein